MFEETSCNLTCPELFPPRHMQEFARLIGQKFRPLVKQGKVKYLLQISMCRIFKDQEIKGKQSRIFLDCFDEYWSECL